MADLPPSLPSASAWSWVPLPVAAALALATVSAFVWAALDRVILKPYHAYKRLKAQGVPGYPFIPVLGQIPEFAKTFRRLNADPAYAASCRATQFGLDGVEKFGKTWTLAIGSTVVLATIDPSIVRQVFITHMDAFVKPRVLKLVRLFGNGLATSEGEVWARQRRLLNPAFHMKEVRRLYAAMVRCAVTAVERWEERAQVEPGEALEMDKEMSMLALSIITATAFGMSLVGTDAGDALLRELQENFVMNFEDSAMVRNMEMAVPFYYCLPTKTNRKMWASEKFIRKAMRGIISERVRKMRGGVGGVKENGQRSEANGHGTGMETEEGDDVDLLQLMLTSTEGFGAGEGGSSSGSSEGQMSEKQLMDECLTFLVAGHETTAVLLTWTMLQLSQHTEWKDKARAEVQALSGGAGREWAPKFEDLGSLKLCQCILQEALRFMPPVPGFVRTCVKDKTVSDGLTVPAGVDVFVMVEAMNMSRELWGPDAGVFNPSRFAEGAAKAVANPVAYMPFGLGPRVCIGQNFALVEAKMVLALLLNRFEWEVHESYAHFPVMGLTVRPKHGLPVVLRLLKQED